ncbi:hypothetical protein TorRG33x02_104670 [Trema orientale]|uniref:Uncharacterized protein n=1 Tax=Trema orientale TaxID=63057 RepID=A0A2P5F7J0_TREOI|nr:hypothetical protein TorRG33x02_104670 [Trema orientale]
MGSPVVLEVRCDIGSAKNLGVARFRMEYLSEGACLRKSEWLPLMMAYKMKVRLSPTLASLGARRANGPGRALFTF